MLKKMRFRAKVTADLCLLMVLAATIPAQAPRSKPADRATLRSRFVAVFGKDFGLVYDKFTTRPRESGGETFWLAYAKPKHTGYFSLQYRYRYDGKLYSHVEHEIHFGVGPKGCRRGPPYAGTYSRFCLGDTVILPILIERFTEHEFRLVKAEPLDDEKDWETFDDKHPETLDPGLDQTQVANPAAESLRYVGYRSHRMLHRKPGYTLELYADFEAVKPGRFNLLVSSSTQIVTPGKTPAGSVPIIVVARETPVTLIAGHEDVRGFTVGYDGREYESSTSGNGYMTNLIILQPGDRISLLYRTSVHGGDFERGRAGLDAPDPRENIKPVISVHPFLIDSTYDFTAWLLDYLPK
jgi:hypothetical protein